MGFALVMANSLFTGGSAHGSEQYAVTHGEVGRAGGRLVISQRAELKTLNPLMATDENSKEIIGLINADLIHINRYSQKTEAALARSWTVSSDARVYTLELRTGVKFSDGQPFDADDVLFTFQVYLDERVHSPQRDLLVVGGKPIQARKLSSYTVQFELAEPYAAGERLFDSIAILPRHLLKQAYDEGTLAQAWTLTTPPRQIVGLGPFQVKEYVPGQHIALERNPYYWKKDSNGIQLPYLDEIVSLFTGNADAEAMRFEQGEIDVVSRLNPATFDVLEKQQRAGGFRVYDLGPGFEYDFLFFNLNDVGAKNLPAIAASQTWFQRLAFRQAVSAAIDRKAIVRLAYRGRAYALSTYVTPGNKLWMNPNSPKPVRSAARARSILQAAGFSWRNDGSLVDDRHEPVSFSIVFNAANIQHKQAATLLQADLAEIGIGVRVVPLEFRALLDRVFNSFDYDAAIMALASGDADPNSEINVWDSHGGAHLWNLNSEKPRMPWEEEIDRLMHRQMITPDYEQRKRMYDRVQQLVWENLPLICFASPDVLVGATSRLENFNPAILGATTLWNAEELYFRR
jgi:peptide/nickel transport system substrate-binding protein